jgi:heme-degrading monooxygenase HmoA
MKRRTYLKSVLAGACSLTAVSPAASNAAAAAGGKIQLHVDLSVNPTKEPEMLHNFKTIFGPAAAKQPGYIDVQMLKLHSAIQGSAPAGLNYRFVLTYASEELRQKWVASETHKKVWPTIERTLSSTNYTVLLFDVA